MTMRHSMANKKKLRNGPSTNDSGPTHASVSESTIDDVTDVVNDAIIEDVRGVIHNRRIHKHPRRSASGE